MPKAVHKQGASMAAKLLAEETIIIDFVERDAVASIDDIENEKTRYMHIARE